ncbi:MAG: hypothetical protein Q7R31_04515 [Candidatus Levybacteria bacterium]|nr:hypothetical protein [Candidatus Levybacteria bacterium]
MRRINRFKKKLLTLLFYGSIGLAASLFLFLIFYWNLSLNSSIYSLINNTKSEPVYLWSYVILTFGTIILFGVNAVLFVYRWRKFGPPKLKIQGGSGLGALVGVAASACPVCGSLLLSAIGITAGLAVFPLQGLELKALSFGLMALPVWLTTRELKSLSCGDETCPILRPTSFRAKDKPYLITSMALVAVLILIGWNMLKTDPIVFGFFNKTALLNPNDNKLNTTNTTSSSNKIYDEVVAKVLPEQGFQSKISLKDSILKLVDNGVIDRQKFEEIYKQRGLPNELKDVLGKPSNKLILLKQENANIYVNLLWALGLSNYMSTNKDSPVNGKSLFNFASTGGWNIGKEENGGAYFNKFRIVELTPEQEVLVTQIAKNTYRPCCNNSTFFQDCNHGSALLGLLQLGASQGLTEDELYKEALAFNSFWFPQNYTQTALYFKVVKNTDWEKVSPKEVMGINFSAVSNWAKNVQAEIAKIPNLIPQTKGGGGCGV